MAGKGGTTPASIARKAGSAKKSRHETPFGDSDSDNESDIIVVQEKATTPITPAKANPYPTIMPPIHARTKVTPAKPVKEPAQNVVISNEEPEDIMAILARSPPPDEQEWFSRSTEALGRANPESVPINAPLISGPSAVEKQLIRQEMIDAGVNLIPKAEWRQMLRDQGIHPATGFVPDYDIRLDLWLKTCIPPRFLPKDKRQWCHLGWLMDESFSHQPHAKFLEAEREGDYAKMLFYEGAVPDEIRAIAGTTKEPQVFDPPGSGGPFDTLRPYMRPHLIKFLNTREFWEEPGWTEEVLKLIPSTIMAEVSPEALAKMPFEVISAWPKRLRDTLPEDAPFYAAKDGLPIWEEARMAKAARREKQAPSWVEPRPAELRRTPRRRESKVAGKKPRKQLVPTYNPNAVRQIVPEFPVATPVVLQGPDDSDATIDDPTGKRLTDSSPLSAGSDHLHLGADLTRSPSRSIRDLLPSSSVRSRLSKQTVVSISSDETTIEPGSFNQEGYKSVDPVFLGNGFISSDLPKRDDWLPMSTKYSESDDEEFIVQGSHPDYWLNMVFRNIPVFDTIYDCLEALLGTLSDAFKQEEHFVTRPSIRLSIPDQLKSLLVDDWENVTKSLLLVPLPSQAPANFIIDTYYNEEKNNRRLGSADADLLLELCCGLKLYFEKAVGKILLYRFERLQLAEVIHAQPLPHSRP